MKAEKCYYENYGTCSYQYCKYRNKACAGAGECERFISESDYFMGMMNGTITDEKPKEDPKVVRDRIEKALRLDKSKKQMKREEKLEKQKNEDDDTLGVSLGDLFGDVFKNKK